MPNYCDYEMKITGTKDAIKEVIDTLKADYNYGESKPAHKHVFRVFDVNDDDELEENVNGTFTQFVWGYCAWSVSSCMLGGNWSYYKQVKENHPDIFMGTTLDELSKDLQCKIEVFSEETGCAFSEHYLFDNGECIIDESIEISCDAIDSNGNVVDSDSDDIDYYRINNDHREEGTSESGYKWEI